MSCRSVVHRRPLWRRLPARVYFTAVLLLLVVGLSLQALPRFIVGPLWLQPQAAMLQGLINRLSEEPLAIGFVMNDMRPRIAGSLSISSNQQVIATTKDRKALSTDDVATTDELDELQSNLWTLAWNRIVVRSDDHTLVGVYLVDRPAIPWRKVLPFLLAILALVGLTSYWLSMRLARPLARLADAAQRFGEGQLDARSEIKTNDELGDVGRAFDQMAARTETVLQSQRQMLADISHELRTPLARIRVALELVIEAPNAARDLLADLTLDLNEVDNLIADILVAARLEGAGSNAPELRREEVTINELLSATAARFAARYPDRVLEIDIVDGVEIQLHCEPRLMRRAIDNLVENAAKYSATGPVRIEVRRASDGEVTLLIRDQGIGMTTNELQQAFTPFWRADSSRSRQSGGVGLGLALVRRIIHAHGGTVELASSVGVGTIATIALP